MLKGVNYPLTPKGKSTLNPPPPRHYSADFLNIEFWSEPNAVAAVLPPGLGPDPAAQGHGNALFYDWQFTAANEEYLDPARYQYRGYFLLVDALFEGKPISYCPYIFVDNDVAIPPRMAPGSSDRCSLRVSGNFSGHEADSPGTTCGLGPTKLQKLHN